jgi:cyclopropane fatty-acyl-phospholipid synthase-like methyltransferase
LEFVLARFAKDISILDCGAGTGAWVEKLRSSGFRGLLAVDIDAGQYHGPAPFLRADLNGDFADTVISGDCTPSGQGFDLITAIEVIEHLKNASHFLRQCRQLLKPNGRLLITTPNVECVPGRFKFLLRGKLRHFDEHSDPTHISPVFFSLLRRIGQQCGFEISEYLPVPGRSYSGTVWWKLAISLCLARVLSGNVWGDCTLLLLRPR